MAMSQEIRLQGIRRVEAPNLMWGGLNLVPCVCFVHLCFCWRAMTELGVSFDVCEESEALAEEVNQLHLNATGESRSPKTWRAHLELGRIE